MRNPGPYLALLCAAVIMSCTLLFNCTAMPIAPSGGHQAVTEHQLPDPDLMLAIPGLSLCNDDPDRRLRLNSGHPVTILVHGCRGSAGSFKMLAHVLAFHGQQSVCFSYDDRDSLMHSSRLLADAVEDLAVQMTAEKINIVGHSQGGLIARKALVSERDRPIDIQADIELVTISAPLAGIRAARTCGMPILRFATLGMHDLLCWLISGNKWHEITDASDFIQKPGALVPSVGRHLLVKTDERGSCRRFDAVGRCREDDFVFAVAEQELLAVHTGIQADEIAVRAGHVEIIGESGVQPEKLIRVLQKEGYILPTPPSRIAQFKALLAHLYDDPTLLMP